MVEVWLPYGKTEVCIRIPTQNLLKVVEPNRKDASHNPHSEIESSLANPIGTPSLSEIIKPESKVALVLGDTDTQTNQMIVSALLKKLTLSGMKEENLTVIVAYDPLRDFLVGKQLPLLGNDLLSRVKVVSHDPEKMEYVNAGETSRGTKLLLNKSFAEADVKIVAGVVMPHPFAGYSSAADLILLGISSFETIRHSYLFSLDKAAERGRVKNNPVHEEIMEAARLANIDFCLNIVRNDGFEVVKTFAGDVQSSFNEAIKIADEIFRVKVESRADVVYLSPGGFPFDGTLFETCKCLDAAVDLCKRDGSLVLTAECAYGLGDQDFVYAISKFNDVKSLEKDVRKNFSINKLMAYRLQCTAQNFNIFLVSVIPDYFLTQIRCIKSARTANEAYRYASEIAGRNGKVSFVPYGNMTVSQIGNSE